MTTILRFILFSLLTSAVVIVAQAAGTFQDDFHFVEASFGTESAILESADGEIFSYDSSGVGGSVKTA